MMPEKENIPSPDAAPAPLPPAAKKSLGQLFWPILALAALGLAGWQWQETRVRLGDVQQEASRRLAEVESARQQALGAQKQLREQVDALQARVGALDGRFGEFQTQSAALQGLYQDIAHSREEAMLLEVEQAITLAGQQLQLAGNIPVAALALQAADARLARLDRPQYLPLRKALSKDLERLNALPFVDVPGISLRLEQLVAGADKWPLASLQRPSEKSVAADPQAVASWWQRSLEAVWGELKGLVRIQRFDREDSALLAPGQSFFLRENLKLRLLNTRLALLAHDQSTFRGELKALQEWLLRYFDRDDPAVQGALATLRQMAGAELNVDLPDLKETQAALAALRNGKEKR